MAPPGALSQITYVSTLGVVRICSMISSTCAWGLLGFGDWWVGSWGCVGVEELQYPKTAYHCSAAGQLGILERGTCFV